MKCWSCETKEVEVIVVAVDGYYADKGVCGDDVCQEDAEYAQYSWVEIVPLAEYPAENIEYLEYA
jgi:hypothetical protein